MINAPPSVKLIPVITAVVLGLVITPAVETDPPLRFAVVHEKAGGEAAPFTVTAID